MEESYVTGAAMKILRWILFAAALALLCVEVDAGQDFATSSEAANPPFRTAVPADTLTDFDGVVSAD